MKFIKNLNLATKIIASVVLVGGAAAGAGLIGGSANTSYSQDYEGLKVYMGTGFANYKDIWNEAGEKEQLLPEEDKNISFAEFIKRQKASAAELGTTEMDTYLKQLETSYTLMIVGSVLLGLFGAAAIAWCVVLIISAKSGSVAA